MRTPGQVHSLLFTLIHTVVSLPATQEEEHKTGSDNRVKDESEKRMEEEIICNRWKDLADETA